MRAEGESGQMGPAPKVRVEINPHKFVDHAGPFRCEVLFTQAEKMRFSYTKHRTGRADEGV